MAAQLGRALVSAWGQRSRNYSSHLATVRREAATPEEIHNPWLDWWMDDVVAGTSHTKALSDSIARTPRAGLTLGL